MIAWRKVKTTTRWTTRTTPGGGGTMNVRPQLEELETRSALSLADLAAFQQQFLPPLQAQFNALVPAIQSTLQADLNQQKAALAPFFPAANQSALNALFAPEQQFVNG